MERTDSGIQLFSREAIKGQGKYQNNCGSHREFQVCGPLRAFSLVEFGSRLYGESMDHPEAKALA